MSGELSWFNGDKDALDFYQRLVNVAHSWDDLIDRDAPIGEQRINNMVMDLLLFMPSNAFYRKYEEGIRAHLFSSIASYQAANLMERSGDAHKLEIAHYLRYAVMSVVTFMFVICHGIEGAAKLLVEVSSVMMPERIEDYVKEHTK